MDKHTVLLLVCGLLAAICIPLIMRIVPPNPVYGFKTRRIMASESLWYRANFFGGCTLFLAAVLSAVLLVSIPAEALPSRGYSVALLVVPVLTAALVSCLYMWKIQRSEGT